MGYTIDMQLSNVQINQDKLAHAHQCLTHALEGRYQYGSGLANGKRSYAFVSHDACKMSLMENDLCAALSEWRYASGHDSDGHLVIHEFTGENLGDDKHFWKMLAPAMQDGGYIHVTAEDGSEWRWVFHMGQLLTVESSS